VLLAMRLAAGYIAGFCDLVDCDQFEDGTAKAEGIGRYGGITGVMGAAPPVQVGQKQLFAHGVEREIVPSARGGEQRPAQTGCGHRVVAATHDRSGDLRECGFEDADCGSRGHEFC